MTKKIDQVYKERAIATTLFAKMAMRLGYNVGKGVDEGWTVLYVETPEGQFSWHYSPDDDYLIEDFPEFKGKWDGTFNGRNGQLVSKIKV